MHPTPLHAPSVTHICSHFLRFLFIFAQPQKLPPGRCVGQCVVWGRFGCTWVWETIKALDSENRHHPGHPRAPRRTHIFPHFSEFLRIFHRRYEVNLNTHPPVCVRAGLLASPAGRPPAPPNLRLDTTRAILVRRVERTFFHIFLNFCGFSTVDMRWAEKGTRVWGWAQLSNKTQCGGGG